jgi:hypothetical protein
MGRFRRWTQGGALAAAAFIASANHGTTQGATQLRLETTNHRLRLVNPGPAVTIRSAIEVEKQDERGWIPVKTELHAIARCEREDPPDKLEIAAAATLDVVPWRGYTCSGQCHFVCHGNFFLGPGTFRYIVTTVPAGERLVSPTFTLPAMFQMMEK